MKISVARLLGLVFGIIATPLASAAYTAIDLHPGGFGQTIGLGAGTGQQAGYGYGPATSNQPHALLWSGTAGSYVDLNPGGFTYSVAQAAGGGQQVGYGSGSATSGQVHALLWSGTAGSHVDLNPSGFAQTIALGVSGGKQVGYGSGSATSGAPHALLWSGTAGSYVDLNPSGFTNSFAEGIGGGQQVGYGYGPATSGAQHALLWSGTAASHVDLNPIGFSYSAALGADGGRQVGFGTSATSGEIHALLWSGTAGSYVDLNPLGFSYSVAWSVSGGRQVGTGNGAATSNQYHALLWHGTAGSYVDLHAMLSSLPGSYDHSEALGIASNGDVVGFALNRRTGIQHAILWDFTPDASVPEPGTLLLLALGLIGIAGSMRKRAAAQAARLRCLAAFGFAIACAQPSQAAITTLVQTRHLNTFASGPFASTWSCGCTTFDRFDPSLGTLLRVDYADSGQFDGQDRGDHQYSFSLVQRMIYDESAAPATWPIISNYFIAAAPDWRILFSTSGTVPDGVESYFVGAGTFRMAQYATFSINGFPFPFAGLTSFMTLTYVYDDAPVVAAVPSPATPWLLGSGVIGLLWFGRRRATVRSPKNR